MDKNYNYNYENINLSSTSHELSTVEIVSCTKAVMNAMTPVNGQFFHTTDTNEFYYDWNKTHILLNVSGTDNLEELIEQAQSAVSAANSAATVASNAAAAVAANADHFTNGNIHVTVSEKSVWNAKQDALSEEQINAIAAVSGKQDVFDNASVLSGITSSKVSAWDAVAAGSYDASGAADSALSSAKNYTDTEISSLNWVKSVNGATGDVTVRTFTLVDDDRINTSGTVKEFCDDLYNILNPQAGTAYLAEVSFNKKNAGDEEYDEYNSYNNMGMPETLDLGNGELIIYVPVEGVYELEMYSTNGFDKDYSISGKWMAMYDGGTMLSPWKGFMTASFEVTTSDGYQYIAHNDADGISKYYLEHNYQPLTSAQISALTAVSGKQDAFENADILSAISQTDIDNWNMESDATGVSKAYVDDSIATAVSEKLNILPVVSEAGNPDNGYPYWIPYDTVISSATDKINVTLKCLTLDNNLTKMSFDKELSGATASSAGVMTAEDKTKLDGISSVSLPTTAISQDWETALPVLAENGDKYVTANDVIAFIQEAILKKKSEIDDGSDTESVYAYITGYPVGGTATDITLMNPFELNETGDTTIEFETSAEIQPYDPVTTDDTEAIKVLVNIPNGYSISYWGVWNSISNVYNTIATVTTNPRYSTITIGDVTYNSYTRTPSSDKTAIGAQRYKITITKN